MISKPVNTPSARSRALGLIAVSMPVLFLITVLFAAGCASEERSVAQEVRTMVDHGQFEEAVRKSADASAAAPDDEALQDLHRDASVAYMLEQGRRLTFEDKDVEALAAIQSALEIDPNSKEARDWLDKTDRKLALRHLNDALEEHAKDQIKEALENYQQALVYMPADKDALIGRELCLNILKHREELGVNYFDEGVRALSDYWLEQARSRFSYSYKYRPGEDRTQDRKTQVEKLLSEQRMSTGEAFEKDHMYGAARNDLCLPSSVRVRTLLSDDSLYVASCGTGLVTSEPLNVRSVSYRARSTMLPVSSNARPGSEVLRSKD